MKPLALLLLLLLSIASSAQEDSVISRLHEAYRLAWTDGVTLDEVKAALSGIGEDDVISEGDTVRYLFYYLTASILDIEEREPELRDRYIDAAIALREKTVGVLSSEYLELVYLKAYNLNEGGREDEAIRFCRRGIVVGHELVEEDHPVVMYWYGHLMQLLGQLYVSKGYDNQVISLYNESFDLLQGAYNEDDASSWLPLLCLCVYYLDKGMYEEAYQTNERLGEHIRVNGGEKTLNYADTYLYQRGNTLRSLGRIEEAVQSYREGANLLMELGAGTDESLDYLYSNWQYTLVENGMFDEATAVEEAMTAYYTAIDHTAKLSSIYRTLAALAREQGANDKALEYIAKSEQYLKQIEEEQ